MKIESRTIDKVIPYTRNPRKIPPQAISAVAGSIKEFGFKQPIIVDGEGVIIAGHTRLLAAQSLGLEKVPVLVASDLTPAQVQAFRLADAEFDKILDCFGSDDVDRDSSAKEIDVDSMVMGNKCPRCGFEFDGK